MRTVYGVVVLHAHLVDVTWREVHASFCQMRLPDLVAGDHECKVQKLEMKNRILRQHCDESEMVT